MSSMFKKMILVWLLGLMQIAVASEPDVILDTGRTIPVPSHMMPLDAEAVMREVQSQRQRDKKIRFDYAYLFPLSPTSMTLGVVQTERREMPQVLNPLFIVGCDQTSFNWLRDRKLQLLKAKAEGFVIECQSMPMFRHLVALFPELTLTPTPEEQLAKAFGLIHYPVVITSQGIAQ